VLDFLATYALLSHAAAARECTFEKGEDRWEIKTSLPQGAFSHGPVDVDLASFMKLKNPTMTAAQKRAIAKKLWPDDVKIDDRVFHEGDLIRVRGFLYRARCQKDGDYHLEIGISSKDGRRCLIVELPDANEIADRILQIRVEQAIKALNNAPSGIFNRKGKPVQVLVTGQLFLDAHHLSKKGGNPSGGRGSKFNGKNCATNVWEIHPVTDLVIGDQ
jgi:hypothetical protein